MVDKVIRDGKVAVLISPGFGAGWSTWSHTDDAEAMLYCPAIVAAIETGASVEVAARKVFPDAYLGGLDDIVVQWLPVGTVFYVREYDGSESLVIFGRDTFVA